jgi:hypothetical protein
VFAEIINLARCKKRGRDESVPEKNTNSGVESLQGTIQIDDLGYRRAGENEENRIGDPVAETVMPIRQSRSQTAENAETHVSMKRELRKDEMHLVESTVKAPICAVGEAHNGT